MPCLLASENNCGEKKKEKNKHHHHKKKKKEERKKIMKKHKSNQTNKINQNQTKQPTNNNKKNTTTTTSLLGAETCIVLRWLPSRIWGLLHAANWFAHDSCWPAVPNPPLQPSLEPHQANSTSPLRSPPGVSSCRKISPWSDLSQSSHLIPSKAILSDRRPMTNSWLVLILARRWSLVLQNQVTTHLLLGVQ